MDRRLGVFASVLVAFATLSLSACDGPQVDPPPIDTSVGSGPSRYVQVFVGSDDAEGVADPVTNGAGGSTFPAAAAPFGMVQFGPDTPWAIPPGYKYSDDQIVGFSVNHLNGAGCPAQRDFPLTPMVGDVDPEATLPFSHSQEVASPGLYEVRLASGVTVDLTATPRTGMARFRFPKTSAAHLLLRSAMPWDLLVAKDASLQVVSSTLVTGWRSDAFCAMGVPTKIYFAARFDRPFSARSFGTKDETQTHAEGIRSGLVLSFSSEQNPIVHVKIGLSSVSIDGALRNLDAENPDWDFAALRKKTLASWDDYLGRLAVSGGSEELLTMFYSALYRVFLQPSVWSDVDGSYLGFDQNIHASDGHVHYANFSGWDIYRSWIQLVAWLAPKETSDIVRSLILDGQQGGALPKWAYGASETGVMIGDPADALIANAWAFGAQDFDPAAALALMLHGAKDPTATCNELRVRPGLSDCLDRHYCPVDGPDGVSGSVAATLEYAIADAALGQFAAMQCDAKTAREFADRSRYWRNVFDPRAKAGSAVGLLQPRRRADVAGAADFVVAKYDDGKGVVEGSLEQYSFMVPQDVPGLIDAMGGDAAFVARLDEHLQKVNAGTKSPHFYIGNEPGFATPWLYPFAGSPWKTQEAVHRIVTRSFSATPRGLPGNEDLGALSSWLVFAMLGIYPEAPGVPGFVVGSPFFPQIAVKRPGQADFHISALGLSDPVYFIVDATLQGRPLRVPWLTLDQMKAGGELTLTVSSRPNLSWGAAPADRPQTQLP